jgi:hypothetical protein
VQPQPSNAHVAACNQRRPRGATRDPRLWTTKHAVGISWGHPLAPVAGVAAHHPLATTMLVVIMLALVASIGLATAECNGEDCKEETCP